MIREFLAGQGRVFDPSTYSVQNLPESRVSDAPDLTHAVLANGKTMEKGANYLYSLLLGYDRLNDAVLGKAIKSDVNENQNTYVQVGGEDIAVYEDGSTKSVTTRFEKNNFYLYGDQDNWVLRNFVDIRTDVREFDQDGMARPLVNKFSHRLDEAASHHAVAYAAESLEYTSLRTANEVWQKRESAPYHEVLSWASGQFYNPFKDGGILSMRSPLVDLENFHRTNFTVEDLAKDASDLENATYWLRSNQELQPRILTLVPALQEAYDAIPAGETAATYRPFFDAAQPVQNLLDQLQPETKSALAEDIAAWLAFSSDMNLNTRKQTGLYVVVLFAILSILLYFYYREVARHEFARQAKEGGPWDNHHQS